MTRENLSEFIELAQTRNYLEASYNLHISQSSLSKHIQTLEHEIGCSLFERSTRSVSLSECGKIFYNYAIQEQLIYDKCISDINKIIQSNSSEFSVAYSPALGSYDIIELLTEFSNLHPEQSINMIESTHAMEMLTSHSCNYIAAVKPTYNLESFEYLPFANDHLCVVLPASHSLPQQDSIDIEQLRGETYIIYNDLFGEVNMFIDMCKKHGFEPAKTVKSIFRTNAMRLISQGLGFTVISYRSSLDLKMSDNLRVIDLNPSKDISVGFLRLKDYSKTDKDKLFEEYIQKHRLAD